MVDHLLGVEMEREQHSQVELENPENLVELVEFGVVEIVPVTVGVAGVAEVVVVEDVVGCLHVWVNQRDGFQC